MTESANEAHSTCTDMIIALTARRDAMRPASTARDHQVEHDRIVVEDLGRFNDLLLRQERRPVMPITSQDGFINHTGLLIAMCRALEHGGAA